ncbi:MAG: hypothetical protein HKM06_00530 [Spirochaetales bacterium]|nr:hypothetical protein [Spirochaetales bacterium]
MKIGFAFAGAAAFIPQEAAIAKALLEGLTPLGRIVRPDVIAGTSSGALNAVVLNAILRTLDGNAPPGAEFRWGGPGDEGADTYYGLLSSLKNKDIFTYSLAAFAQGGVLDNSPLRRLLEHVAEKRLGFSTLGDLPIPTWFCAVDRATGEPVRLLSRDPQNKNLSLVDVLMASTAIPIVFPPQPIGAKHGKGLEGLYFDGGTGPDSIPVEPLEAENCDEIFLIDRMGTTAATSHKPDLSHAGAESASAMGGFHLDIVENTALGLEYLYRTINTHQIERAARLPAQVWVCEPVLKGSYGVLDFSKGKQQWDETWAWALKNAPRHL